MRLARRITTVAAAVVLVGGVGLILRTLDAMGLFTEGRTPVACTAPQIVRGATGSQDMQYDATSNVVFISAAGWRKTTDATQDGIYAYKPGETGLPVKLKGTPADFHPRGMSLFRDADGSLTLTAINYPTHGHPNVDVYDVTAATDGAVQLHERESVSGDLLVSPAAVVAVDKDRFYVTNEHTSKTKLTLALEEYLVLPWADVVFFDGSSFRVTAKWLTGASGINKSPDGTHIYVAEASGRDIQTYARNSFSGDLTPQGTLQINSGLANITVAPNGSLLVAGQPNLFKLRRYLGNPLKPSPSEVFRVLADAQGNLLPARLIYAGSEIAAASVAIAARERLLIGSAFGVKILSCASPH